MFLFPSSQPYVLIQILAFYQHDVSRCKDFRSGAGFASGRVLVAGEGATILAPVRRFEKAPPGPMLSQSVPL